MKNTDLLELITKAFYDDINASDDPVTFICELMANYRTIADEIWNKAYHKGYEEGENAGYDSGYDQGKEDGYSEGYNDGLNEKNY